MVSKNPKQISTLTKISQIHPLGGFKPSEQEFGHGKSHRLTIEGLQVVFPETFIIAVWL